VDDLPLITITMGDPAGIGPEIILRALSRDDIYRVCRPLILGDTGALRMVSKKAGSPSLHVISSPSEVTGRPGVIDVMPVSALKEDSLKP